MDHRLGTCVSCKAHYRVPATFTASKARCKNCGGVVEIGPVQTAAAGKVFGSAGIEAGTPVGPGGAGLGVKPSIPPPTVGVTGGDAGTPADKPSPVKPVPAKAPPPQPAMKPVRAAAARPAAPPQAAAAGAAKPADGVRGAAERAATRVRSGATAKAGAAARARRSQPARKHNWGMLLGAAALLIVIVAAAVFMLNRNSEPVQANESGKAPPAAPANPETAQGAVETPVAENAPALAEAAPEPEPEAAAKAPPPEPTPEDIDLLALPDQEPLPETSPEDAAQMREWMATFVDPAAGAAGRRAGDRLIARGKEAFPIILNAFKRVDLTTEEGFRTGDLIQRELLMRICNGNNVGWQYQQEKGYLLYDKKAIRTWFKLWGEAKDDPKKWAKLAKLDQKEAEEAEGKPKVDKLDDF